jgi:uncharacterized protein with HEPN domain
MKSDKAYLGHILDAIKVVDEYIGDMTYEEFKGNKMATDAVIRQLAIVGEAANNLSEEFVKSHPDLPFRDAIDMRNFLIHEYFGVNVQLVWETAKDDLPEFKKFIEKII